MEKLSHSQHQDAAPYPILDFLQRRCFLVGVLMTLSKNLPEMTTLALRKTIWLERYTHLFTLHGYIHAGSSFFVICKVGNQTWDNNIYLIFTDNRHPGPKEKDVSDWPTGSHVSLTSQFTQCCLTQIILRANPRNEDTIYWDGGVNKIAAWKEQHLPAVAPSVAMDGLCQENWICNILQLTTLEMEDLTDDNVELDSAPPTARKSKIGYLLND